MVKRDPHALYCDDVSMTKQSFTEECDVNELLRRAANGQDITSALSARVGQYGDFTDIPDFRESLDLVNRANNAFMELPWQTRERFANDPGRMIEFLQDDANYDEAVKMGILDAELVKKRREAAVAAAAPTPPPAAKGDGK